MTLEIASNVSSDKIATLKKIDHSFKPGWLQDEVIGSYLFNLVRQHNQVKYCGSILDVKLNKISILDPLSKCYLKENKYRKLCVRVRLELFQRKFNKTNIKIVTSTEHVLQQDSHNCGVFVCYCAKRICEG